MGNSLWVVTPENTIIVFDVPESNEVSLSIRNAMRQQPEIGTKPITFLIYTIFQGDHTFGAQVNVASAVVSMRETCQIETIMRKL